MGQALHGSGTTREAVRRAIQLSQESLRVAAQRHGSPEDRRQVEEADADGGCADWWSDGPKSTACRRSRRHSSSRSGATRCLRLTTVSTRYRGHDPAADAGVVAPVPAAAWRVMASGRGGRKAGQLASNIYPIGFFHIDVAEVRSEEGKLYSCVAMDRASKGVLAGLHDKAD